MKNSLYLFFVIILIGGSSCDDDDNLSSIEGRWLSQNADRVDILPNTMYEFKNELIHTTMKYFQMIVMLLIGII